MTGPIVTPSSARRVPLDGFLPVPRGSAPRPVQLPVWPVKDPGDVLDYEVDASPALVDSEGDAIATLSVVAQPSDLVIGATAAMGLIGVVWLSGGTAGTTYTVQLTIGTTGGRTLSRAVLLPVQSLTTPSASNGNGSASTLTTEAGVVITNGQGAPILVSG